MAVHARTLSQGTLTAGRDQVHRHDLALAATGCGLTAGAAMLAFIAACSAAAGHGAARPLELTAATVLGAAALEGGPLAIAAGLLLWGAVSVVLALMFAAVVPRDFPFASATMMGVGYALVVIGFMSALFLPWLNTHMKAEMPELGGSWVLAYALFGFLLGFVPRLRRWLAGA